MNARDEEFSELARPGPKSAAQTPAPPKERIKGSKENPEGTAATRSKGNILIGGKPLRLAGWKKVGKRGPFLSLSVDNKPKNPSTSKVDEADDDLGF